jgi:magnesium transporter
MSSESEHATDRAQHAATAAEPIVAGNGTARALAGRDTDIPEPVEEVVQGEGEVQPAASAEATFTAWLFRADSEPRQVGLAELPALVAADENFAWADLSGYAERDLRAVAEVFGLDDRAVQPVLAPWQRPKLEMFGDYFLATATVALLDSQIYQVHAAQLGLFVGRNFLLSTHKRPLPFASEVLTRARHNPKLVQLDSAFMLYIILDQLLEYYEDLGQHLEDEIEKVEERALTDNSDAFLADLLRFKRYVFALTRLADQHRSIFAAFQRADFPYVSDEQVGPYYRDLAERLARLGDALLAAKEAVNGAFDIYVSQISHRTNQVMKILTIVSTTLLPSSLILGFFGTNFEGVPLYSQIGFWVMLASILVLSVAILLLFRRRGWF